MKKRQFTKVLRYIFSIFVLTVSFGFQAQAQNESSCPVGSVTIENASFEYPVVTHDLHWDIFSNNVAGLGWGVSWLNDTSVFQSLTRPNLAQLEIHHGIFPWAPSDGNQYAELDSDWNGPNAEILYGQPGEPASVLISQDITTISDATYQLSFDFSARPMTDASDNVLAIYWSGDLVDTISTSNETNKTLWTTHSYTLISLADVTEIAFADVGNSDTFGTFLDNVRLELISCSETNSVNSGSTGTGTGDGSTGYVQNLYDNNHEEETEVISETEEAEGQVAGVSDQIVDADISYCEAEVARIMAVTEGPQLSDVSARLLNLILGGGNEATEDLVNKIAYFIDDNSDWTHHLGAGERAGVVDSFQTAFERLPVSQTDWMDVCKISRGRWPQQRSEKAEIDAQVSFELIYERKADLENQNDSAAVTIMAYGLRPNPRNLSAEVQGILFFKNIFGTTPVNAKEWDQVRAISYSGAVR